MAITLYIPYLIQASVLASFLAYAPKLDSILNGLKGSFSNGKQKLNINNSKSSWSDWLIAGNTCLLVAERFIKFLIAYPLLKYITPTGKFCWLYLNDNIFFWLLWLAVFCVFSIVVVSPTVPYRKRNAFLKACFVGLGLAIVLAIAYYYFDFNSENMTKDTCEIAKEEFIKSCETPYLK